MLHFIGVLGHKKRGLTPLFNIFNPFFRVFFCPTTWDRKHITFFAKVKHAFNRVIGIFSDKDRLTFCHVLQFYV